MREFSTWFDKVLINFRQLREGTLEENRLQDGSRLTLLPNVETGLLVSLSFVLIIFRMSWCNFLIDKLSSIEQRYESWTRRERNVKTIDCCFSISRIKIQNVWWFFFSFLSHRCVHRCVLCSCIHTLKDRITLPSIGRKDIY